MPGAGGGATRLASRAGEGEDTLLELPPVLEGEGRLATEVEDGEEAVEGRGEFLLTEDDEEESRVLPADPGRAREADPGRLPVDLVVSESDEDALSLVGVVAHRQTSLAAIASRCFSINSRGVGFDLFVLSASGVFL